MITQVGPWYFMTKQATADGIKGLWYAYAKKEPFVTDGCFVREPGELWFSKFFDTEAEALNAIKKEVLN